MREIAAKSRENQDYYSAVTMKFSGGISAEPVRGQQIQEHAVTDLVLHNNENRPRWTSGAAPVAEERQEIIEKHDRGDVCRYNGRQRCRSLASNIGVGASKFLVVRKIFARKVVLRPLPTNFLPQRS